MRRAAGRAEGEEGVCGELGALDLEGRTDASNVERTTSASSARGWRLTPSSLPPWLFSPSDLRPTQGVDEPPDFVDCKGTRVLETAGVEVWRVVGLETECLAHARRGRE